MRALLSQYSLFTRRVVAIGLLLFAILFVWSIFLSPLLGAIQSNLTALDDARYQRMRLQQIEARPSPEEAEALPGRMTIKAASDAEAGTAFTAHFSNLASRNAIELGNLNQIERNGAGQLLQIDFTAFGTEEQISRFISNAENSEPVVRFRNWRIETSEMDAPEMQFTGEALSAWSKP